MERKPGYKISSLHAKGLIKSDLLLEKYKKVTLLLLNKLKREITFIEQQYRWIGSDKKFSRKGISKKLLFSDTIIYIM